MIYTADLNKMIRECLDEENINAKIKLFFKINRILPHHMKIKIPSFITKDYIDSVLYKLEEIEVKI
jgi:predicted DNA-binding protein (UPF0278 family)